MRLLIQNVITANVKIDNKIVGQISRGFCVFVGFTIGDTIDVVKKMADKLVSLRLFNDENGKTNLSLDDINGSILSVSQFTLYGDISHGRRPSFINALKGDESIKLYDYFNNYLRSLGYKIETGVFGADMKVNIINDGPFTIFIDSKDIIK